MPGQQQTILLLGGALIAVNFIANGQSSHVWQVIWDGKAVSTVLDKQGTTQVGTLRGFALEFLFLAILVLFAGIGQGGFTVALLVVIAMWLIWAMENNSTLAKWLRA